MNLAKRFKWWWRDGDNSFVVTSRGTTKRNSQFDNDTTIVFECGAAKITKADEMRADFHFWKDGYEKAAHSYELARRIAPKLKLPPYSLLNGAQKSHLLKIGQSSFIYPIQETTANYHDCLNDPKWSFPVRFNLKVSDGALRKAFEHFIAQQRDLKKIGDPSEIPPKNTVSWKWLEVWDENERAAVALTTSEHSMKTRAKRRAKMVLDSVLEALRLADQQINLQR